MDRTVDGHHCRPPCAVGGTATVTADTDVHCYQLPVWSFRPLVDSHPAMAWALLKAVAQRLRTAQARAESA